MAMFFALAGGSAPEAPAGPFLPCASAAEVVSASLAGEPPAALPTWPLYETELTISPSDRRLRGRMQVVLAAPDEGLDRVAFVLPPAETPGQPPVRITEARSVVGEGPPTAPATLERHRRFVEIGLPRTPRRGERVAVHLVLEGDLPRRGSGNLMESIASVTSTGGTVGSVGAVGTDGEGVTLLGAHPTLAPFEDGRWHPVPSEAWGPPHSAPAACHLMSVLVPPGLAAFGTGEQVGEIPEPGGEVRHVFVSAGARRMAVIFRPAGLARHERRVGGVTIRAHAGSQEIAEAMTGWGAGVLRHYAEVYGAYPWTRLELVEGPLNGALGGLRGPGVVLVNDLLTDGEDTTFGGFARPGMVGFMRELVIAHQVAHQWFGEQVDVGGASAPALEKALTWHAVLDYTRTRHGREAALRIRRRAVDTLYHAWRLSGRADMAAGQPLSAIPGLGGHLAICEGKATGLLESLLEPLGRERLRGGLRSFVASHRFGSAGRARLEAALEAAAGDAHKGAVAPAFVRWLDETHGDADLGSPTRSLTGTFIDQLGGGHPEEAAMLEAILEEIRRAMSGAAGP
jgi:hypothetical protein